MGVRESGLSSAAEPVSGATPTPTPPHKGEGNPNATLRSTRPLGKKPRAVQHPGTAPYGVTPAKAGVPLWGRTFIQSSQKLPDAPFERGATLQHLAFPQHQHLPA